ncbi:beta-1,4-xylosyltransferase IRX9 [Silene latifolia]|uniref:beta-1,4-xylosyltransferase IRX9 n=1 Tax=Silene latifolia TaxID=37657 RepID=UPI003D76B9E6
MGSVERSKKRVQIWKKAAVHFALCFVMGFFTGFAPTSKSSIPGLKFTARYNQSFELAPRPMVRQPSNSYVNKLDNSNSSESNRSVKEQDLRPRRQVIVITSTNERDPLRGVLLRRLANTLKLVAPPLLWIVVESQREFSDVSDILRGTGVMYRHLVFKENFTNPRAEVDHQRNLALKHIEHHRLSGVVHFAGLSNVYDLNFFDEIRAIEAFGTWPLAKLSAWRKKMIVEGPVCQSSQILGWHVKNLNRAAEEFEIHISGFGFNSSILWDPERWGRLPATEGAKQDSLKFVKQAVTEDETKIKGVPSEDCSKVNLWQFHLKSETVQVNEVQDAPINDRQI